MVGVDPSGSAQTKDVVAQGVGGIFVGGDATGLLTSGVLQQLQSTTKFGVLVAADEEGGRVQRIDELAGSVPSARDMAATMTVQQVHDLAFARGAQLRKYGITIDFAPDADVSDQPRNTVIGDRSFSASPAVVTAYADAFARGLREA
jgi:beta-N-acetylhexosaminidase